MRKKIENTTSKVEKKCKYCSKIKLVNKYTPYVCEECKKNNIHYKEYFKKRQEKTNKTVKEKYGAENTFLIKDKQGNLKKELTCLEKYGVDNPFKMKKTREQLKEYNLNKYGIDNPFKSSKVMKQIWQEKYGVDNPNKVKSIREKLEKTNLEKYGFINNLTRPEILQKGILSRIAKYGKDGYPFYFTKPHRVLKESININIPNNKFKTEGYLKINGTFYSLDEIDLKNKIIIFIDGDFWHGNPKKYKPTDKVMNKLVSNIWDRDKLTTKTLENKGYKVLRFWEYDIYNNLESCIYKIKEIVK